MHRRVLSASAPHGDLWWDATVAHDRLGGLVARECEGGLGGGEAWKVVSRLRAELGLRGTVPYQSIPSPSTQVLASSRVIPSLGNLALCTTLQY